MNWWGGVLYKLERNSLSVVLTFWHIGSTTICKTVYDCRSFPPYSGRFCWHSEGAPFVAYTIVEQKTLMLSSAWMFVRLYRLLLIHCIHVSVTKPTCPAFSAWLNTGSAWSLKVTGKAVELCSMALSSKFCAALHGQYIVGSMCICKKCRSLDLSVLVGMPVPVTMVQVPEGPRRYDSVNSWSHFILENNIWNTNQRIQR